jgi:hypothetical protein
MIVINTREGFDCCLSPRVTINALTGKFKIGSALIIITRPRFLVDDCKYESIYFVPKYIRYIADRGAASD